MTDKTLSYKPVVKTPGDADWCGNALRFRTYDEAYKWAKDLSFRWLLVKEYTALPSTDKPNYEIVDGKAIPIKESA